MDDNLNLFKTAIEWMEDGFILVRYSGQPTQSLHTISRQLSLLELTRGENQLRVVPLQFQVRSGTYTIETTDHTTKSFLDRHLGNKYWTGLFHTKIAMAPKEKTLLIDIAEKCLYVPIFLTYSPTNLAEVGGTKFTSLHVVLYPNDNEFKGALWPDLYTRRGADIKIEDIV